MNALRVATGAEMSAIDREAIEAYGIPEAALMERAGFEVAAGVRSLLGGSAAGARVYVLCGGGNNGGDGFVAARYLSNWGARVEVGLAVAPARLRGASGAFFKVLDRMGVPVAPAEGEALDAALAGADIVVDAILGTGFKAPLREGVARITGRVNASGRPVLAVDIPTGVEADTGAASADAIRAQATVTFGLPKVGHLVGEGRECTGALHVAEIGFPRALLSGEGARCLWVREETARGLLWPRPPRGHKGTFGRVLVVAGSEGMAGAAALAALGALRSGAGLVTWAGPKSILSVVQSLVPEATALGLPEQGGVLAGEGTARLVEAIKPGDAVVFGPGLRPVPAVYEALARLAEAGVPLVVDADGLNALARWGLVRARGPLVLTPHPKEAARLLGVSARMVTADPIGAARRIAEACGGVAVLKGSPSVTHDGERAYINGSGDVSLATGGSGDVLSGVIGALLAQGYSPLHAAVLGVFVHGRAGELLAQAPGRHAAIARDVASAVGEAFRLLEA